MLYCLFFIFEVNNRPYNKNCNLQKFHIRQWFFKFFCYWRRINYSRIIKFKTVQNMELSIICTNRVTTKNKFISCKLIKSIDQYIELLIHGKCFVFKYWSGYNIQRKRKLYRKLTCFWLCCKYYLERFKVSELRKFMSKQCRSHLDRVTN